MKRRFIKKITATVLSLTMVVGMVNVVSAAHAANGSNVASKITWDYFSLIPAAASAKDISGIEALLDEKHNGHTSKEDGTPVHPWCWYHALTHLNTSEYPDGQVPFTDFGTQGYVAAGSTATSASFYAVSTGWDAQYKDGVEGPVGDNQWGLRFFSSDIPVEKGRSYTVSFKYKSSLKGKKTIYETNEDGSYKYDSNGERIPVKDANGKNLEEDNFVKHIGFNVINPKNSNGLDFATYSGCTSSGMITADAEAGEKTITVTFKVPKDYSGTAVAVQFVAGAYMVTYPDEVNMKGSLNISDFKVTAGTQYAVKYVYGGKTVHTEYVNPGDKALGYNKYEVKGKTFSGYKKGSANYSLSTPVNSDITLTCVYKATPKPGKAKVKFTAQKKKVKLTLTKIKNCVGYEIKYADNKKMKKAKTKTITKKTYTVKSLKSKKKTYFQIRAYNLDSAKKKVYSKKVLKKTVKVK